jgi:helix-hairpin-helix protein
MDDLKKIPGVGPALAKALNKAGVTSFDQIAAFDGHAFPIIEEKMGWKGKAVNWPKLVENAQTLAANGSKPNSFASGAAAPLDANKAGGGSTPPPPASRSGAGSSLPGTAFRVTTRRASRWRAGRCFTSAAPVEIASLNEADYRAIASDPALTIEPLDAAE